MERQSTCWLTLVATLLFGGVAFAQETAVATLPSVPNRERASTSSNVVEPNPTTAAKSRPGFIATWKERVGETLSKQPSWPIPLVTASSGLVECFRSDFSRQITPAGTDTWNYGNGKGANLVPWYNTEFDAAVPPYIQHNSKAQDGFGDFSMLLKYRLAAADAAHGNYSFSASIGSSLPTGSYKNGSPDATVIPTIYAGKGFGRFDVQSTIGATLPVADTAKLGRVMAWNMVAQYHLGKYFWPEIENNASFYHAGQNDGRTQNFVTPGLMISKIRFSSDSQSHNALVFGGGMQIATSHFHTYNHGLVLTMRTIF